MKSFVLAASGAAALVVSGVASAPAPASSQRVALREFTCQRALDPPERRIAVQAVMRPVPGTVKLALRFQLLRKRSGAATLVHAGDLGDWISPSNPTLGHRAADVWQLTKSVADLAAPADYRFRVGFHWLGTHGRVIAQAVRVTGLCHQTDLRPDLVVRAIAVQQLAASSTEEAYVATIANHGGSPTGPFQVAFQPADGSAATVQTVKSLLPNATTHATFQGANCSSAGAPTITADPAGQVDDRNRSNNSLTATCTPSPAAGATLH